MESSRDELTDLEREVSGLDTRWPRVEYGPSVMVVAVGVLVLLGAIALPWAPGTGGWVVLLGASHLGALPRLFTITALLFGVVVSALALMTRLWAIAWLGALGCGFSVVNGLWAVWSRQTSPTGSGPGIGMILA
ncbi:MAG TPA: hypothetical protein VGM53_19710, partial [Streptosporangiaceae bacterium]